VLKPRCTHRGRHRPADRDAARTVRARLFRPRRQAGRSGSSALGARSCGQRRLIGRMLERGTGPRSRRCPARPVRPRPSALRWMGASASDAALVSTMTATWGVRGVTGRGDQLLRQMVDQPVEEHHVIHPVTVGPQQPSWARHPYRSSTHLGHLKGRGMRRRRRGNQPRLDDQREAADAVPPEPAELPIVASAGDLATGRAEDPQHRADDEEDDPDRPPGGMPSTKPRINRIIQEHHSSAVYPVGQC
jgi:hypothetical protein